MTLMVVPAAPAAPGGCGITDIVACGDTVKNVVGDLAGSAANAVSSSVLDQVALAVGKAVGEVVGTLGTFWVKIPTAGLVKPGTIEWAQSRLWFYMSVIAVASILISGARMAWHARGQDLRELVRSLMQLVLVAGGSVAVVTLMLQAGDGFSTWVLDQSGGGAGFGKRFAAMFVGITSTGANTGGIGSGIGSGDPSLAGTAPVQSAALSAFLVIVLGLFAVLQSLVQIALMIFRAAALVILVGVWPLSAAATNTERGKQWFDRLTGWILAFALYKPVAALIYAVGFKMAGTEKGLMGAIIGLALLGLALVALPALMRLAVPAVAALGSGGSGSGGGAAVGAMAGAAMSGGPTGAKEMPSPRPPTSSSSGSTGGSGASGSTGAGSSSGPAGAADPGSSGPAGSGAGKVPAMAGAGGPSGASSGAAGAGSAGGAATGGGAAGGAAGGSAAGGSAAGPVGAVAAAGLKTGQAVYGTLRDTANDATNGSSGGSTGDSSGGGPSGAQ